MEFVSNVYGVNSSSVIQCNIRDITAHKRAEQIDERLRQSQKMEAVGQLAGGLAHDFNNLLGVMMGYCELIEGRVAPHDPIRKMVQQIHAAGTHAVALTRHLLTFSRRQVFRPVVLDLNTLVTGIEAMLRRLIGDDIEIVTMLPADLGRVRADPTQIEQILMNLAANARDAMPRGGTITIETSNLDLDNTVNQYAECMPGPYVMLSICDTGAGMDSKTLARIFEPFFTTKPPGKGTGLGLSTVYGIAKQSAGYVHASSELGRGTTFKVYLPRIDGDGASIRQEWVSTTCGGHETIAFG